MVKMDRLDLGRTPVSDLRPLAALVNITELQLDETEVSDLSPLSKMTKLQILQMKKTRVSDLSPLKDIKTMKDDAAAVEKESESIKARYTKIFRI